MAEPGQMDEVLKKVRRLLERVPLIDGHNDLAWRIRTCREDGAGALSAAEGSERGPALHTNLRRLRRGAVGGQFWSIFVPCDFRQSSIAAEVLRQFDLVRQIVLRYPDDLEFASTASDVLAIHKRRRIASLMGVEGGHAIEGSLAVLRQYHALGARYLTLTHGKGVGWADSATDTPSARGLTPFGVAVISEMNRIGMIVDLSHTSSETMHATLEVTRAPVLFSHSSARGLTAHPRNVPDEVLRRLPANGGVVMVTFVPAFVSEEVRVWEELEHEECGRLRALYPEQIERQENELTSWREHHPRPDATLSDVADHLDYLRAVCGPDHVGIGSDFDGTDHLPQGLQDVSAFPALLGELMYRGWSEIDLQKVAGLNVLRVLRGVEGVAMEMRGAFPSARVTLREIEGEQSGIVVQLAETTRTPFPQDTDL